MLPFDFSTLMPSLLLPIAAVPAAFVPMRFPATVLNDEPLFRCTPIPSLPEITLPAVAADRVAHRAALQQDAALGVAEVERAADVRADVVAQNRVARRAAQMDAILAVRGDHVPLRRRVAADRVARRIDELHAVAAVARRRAAESHADVIARDR